MIQAIAIIILAELAQRNSPKEDSTLWQVTSAGSAPRWIALPNSDLFLSSTICPKLETEQTTSISIFKLQTINRQLPSVEDPFKEWLRLRLWPKSPGTWQSRSTATIDRVMAVLWVKIKRQCLAEKTLNYKSNTRLIIHLWVTSLVPNATKRVSANHFLLSDGY